MIDKLHTWLIRKIVGKRAVAMNLTVHGGIVLPWQPPSPSMIYGCTIRGDITPAAAVALASVAYD